MSFFAPRAFWAWFVLLSSSVVLATCPFVWDSQCGLLLFVYHVCYLCLYFSFCRTTNRRLRSIFLSTTGPNTSVGRSLPSVDPWTYLTSLRNSIWSKSGGKAFFSNYKRVKLMKSDQRAVNNSERTCFNSARGSWRPKLYWRSAHRHRIWRKDLKRQES